MLHERVPPVPIMQAEQIIDPGESRKYHSVLYDRIGMIASSLCAVHCILMPWLLIFLPVLAGTIFTDAKFENIFVVASILLATICCYLGCTKHGKWGIMALITVGAGILCFVRLSAPPICCLDDISWSHAMGSAFGGSLLATSHFLNLKFSRQITTEEQMPCCPSDNCEAHE